MFICFIIRSKNVDDAKKGKNNVAGSKSSKEETTTTKTTTRRDVLHQALNDEIIPRLVANGTKLVQSWEDQYYVVNEYRANAHQVSGI